MIIGCKITIIFCTVDDFYIEFDIQMDKRQKKEALLKCKESLSNEFSKGIIKCITKFSKEEKVWLENLNEPEIQTKIDNLKNSLDDLFDELYKQAKIIEKMNNKKISQKAHKVKELF